MFYPLPLPSSISISATTSQWRLSEQQTQDSISVQLTAFPGLGSESAKGRPTNARGVRGRFHLGVMVHRTVSSVIWMLLPSSIIISAMTSRKAELPHDEVFTEPSVGMGQNDRGGNPLEPLGVERTAPRWSFLKYKIRKAVT